MQNTGFIPDSMAKSIWIGSATKICEQLEAYLMKRIGRSCPYRWGGGYEAWKLHLYVGMMAGFAGKARGERRNRQV